MPKIKTSRAAAKRFKRTSDGRFKRNQSHRRHILTKKSTKRKRHLRPHETVRRGRYARCQADAALRLRRTSMPRVKRGVTAHARHRKVIAQAKGYRGRRKNVFPGREAGRHPGGADGVPRPGASERGSSGRSGSCASTPRPARTGSPTAGS